MLSNVTVLPWHVAVPSAGFVADCASSAVLMFALNRFVDGYFLLDMAVVFNTAIFDPKRSRWILSHAAIARRYLRGWFALDVLSILPYELLDAGAFRSFRLLRALKVLRLLPGHKFCTLARLSSEVGWNYYDTIKEMEDARKEKSAAFYKKKQALLAERAKAKGLDKLYFDRFSGSHKYLFHGRVKALVDGVREGGITV